MAKNEMDPQRWKKEVLSKYPSKIAKKREKSILVHEGPESQVQIQANVRTIPGIITQRGCTYAGCKGVVLGPTRDIINITHGPIGCGFPGRDPNRSGSARRDIRGRQLSLGGPRPRVSG